MRLVTNVGQGGVHLDATGVELVLPGDLDKIVTVRDDEGTILLHVTVEHLILSRQLFGMPVSPALQAELTRRGRDREQAEWEDLNGK